MSRLPVVRHHRRAITLLEFLMIFVVLGVLAAVLVPNIAGRTGRIGEFDHARSQIRGLDNDLDRFKLNCGRFPKNLDDLVSKPEDADITEKWRGPYLKKPAVDSWGTPLEYRCPGIHNSNAYDLWSVGPDKQNGTDDDIVNWKQ